MQGPRSKPVSLNPLTPKEKWIMIACVSGFAILILLGWIFTVGRVVSKSAKEAKDELSSSFSQVGNTFSEKADVKTDVSNLVGDIKNTIKGKLDEAILIQQKEEAQKIIIQKTKEQLEKKEIEQTKQP